MTTVACSRGSEGCGRMFGGDETEHRHLDREGGIRCRTESELRERGIYPDAFRVYRRTVTIKAPKQAPLFDRRRVSRRRSGAQEPATPLPGIQSPSRAVRARQARHNPTEAGA